MSEDELLIKAIHDAADAEDDSLRTLLLDSLNMTEAQYVAYWDSLLFAIQNPFSADTISRGGQFLMQPDFNFSVHPNPTAGDFTISVQLPAAEEIALFLLSMDGKLKDPILPPTRMEAGSHELQVDLGPYAVGLYRVLLERDSGVESRSVVKMQ